MGNVSRLFRTDAADKVGIPDTSTYFGMSSKSVACVLSPSSLKIATPPAVIGTAEWGGGEIKQPSESGEVCLSLSWEGWLC